MAYNHDTKDPNLMNLHKAMVYDEEGEPSLRVSIEQLAPGVDLTITGDVIVTDITGVVEISNDVGNPIPVSGTVNANIVGSPVVGSNKPFYLEVAQGQIAGYSFNHKFGAVSSMSTNTTGTIWDIDDTVYPWTSWDTAGTITLTRASASDADKVVTVQGLDSNYNVASEDITLTAASGNAGTVSWKRVNRMFMIADGGGNVGHVTAVKGGVNVARITAGYGQTLMAVYTVPAGKTGYLLQGTMTAQNGADATGIMLVRYFGTDVFRTGHTFEVSGAGGQYDYEFSIPIPITEKSDIDVRASTRSNNGRYTAAFDILLVDN
jgi:hypothetical protein